MYLQPLLLVLATLLLGGCSMKQVLHPFPADAEQKLHACENCRVLEILNDGSSYVMRDVASGQTYKAFEYRAGAIQVERKGLLKPLRGTEVSQADTLDYAGKRYRLQARLRDTGDDGVHVVRERPGPATLLGRLDLPARSELLEGQIGAHRFRYRQTRSWGAQTRKRKESGKTVWHQYPAGSLALVENDAGWQAELLTGSQVVDLMGLSAYSGPVYKLQIKQSLEENEEEALLVFLFAAMLAQEFHYSAEMALDCLGMNKDDRNANGCSNYGVP